MLVPNADRSDSTVEKGEKMTTTAALTRTDSIVLDYLAALWAQSEDLQPELRDELMSTVADYIAARRATVDDPAEIVRWLGPPEALAAALSRGQFPPHVRMPVIPQKAGRPEKQPGGPQWTAIGLLTAGALILPVVSPVAGMLLVTGSPQWTPAEKAIGWLATLGTAAGAFALVLVFAALSFVSGFAALLLYLAVSAGSLAAGATLFKALREREQG
jgi:uncharacterized membrane protein